MVHRFNPRCCGEASVSLVGLRHHAGTRTHSHLADGARIRHQWIPGVRKTARRAQGTQLRPKGSPRVLASDARPTGERRRALSFLAAWRWVRPKHYRTANHLRRAGIHTHEPRAPRVVRKSRRLVLVQRGGLSKQSERPLDATPTVAAKDAGRVETEGHAHAKPRACHPPGLLPTGRIKGGIDHERLTYRFQGRGYRLTDVSGHVVQRLLARSR